MANRSAKGGTRSSPHYGGEGILIHPPHQGVCGRHGTEDLVVTPGDLVWFPNGIGISEPISRQTKGRAMPSEKSDDRVVPEASRKRCDPPWGGQPSGLGKAVSQSSEVVDRCVCHRARSVVVRLGIAITPTPLKSRSSGLRIRSESVHGVRHPCERSS